MKTILFSAIFLPLKRIFILKCEMISTVIFLLKNKIILSNLVTLYVITMSRTRFRVNLHSIVAERQGTPCSKQA